MKGVITAVVAVFVRILWFSRYVGSLTGQTPPSAIRILGLSKEDRVIALVSFLMTIVVGLLGLNPNPWSVSSITGSVLFIYMAVSSQHMICAAVITSPIFIETVIWLLADWLFRQINSTWLALVQPAKKKPLKENVPTIRWGRRTMAIKSSPEHRAVDFDVREESDEDASKTEAIPLGQATG